MSIDKVEVKNSQGNLLTLSLEDISNGYIVEDIDGLGPVKASIASSKFATMPGEQYQATSRDSRNITLKLGYAPNVSIGETVGDLRDRLYQYFMTGEEVFLTFYMLNGRTVVIEGRVETCEPVIFTREPEMAISLLCLQPDFVSTVQTHLYTQFTTRDTVPVSFTYPGTIPVGLDNLRFTAASAMTGFTIYHTTPAGALRTMLISAPLLTGDVVNIYTIQGQKKITLTRGATTTSLQWAVAPTSTWVELKPGVNQLYLSTDATVASPVLVDYHVRYGGL